MSGISQGYVRDMLGICQGYVRAMSGIYIRDIYQGYISGICQTYRAMGTWNVTSLRRKEPELVREIERCRLEIVGLTSTHSLGSGTQLLQRGWTLFHSGVACGERWRAGVGLLIAPQLSCHVLGVHPSEREGCFPVPSSRR